MYETVPLSRSLAPSALSLRDLIRWDVIWVCDNATVGDPMLVMWFSFPS